MSTAQDIWTGSEAAHREAVEDPNAPQFRRTEVRKKILGSYYIASAGVLKVKDILHSQKMRTHLR